MIFRFLELHLLSQKFDLIHKGSHIEGLSHKILRGFLKLHLLQRIHKRLFNVSGRYAISDYETLNEKVPDFLGS